MKRCPGSPSRCALPPSPPKVPSAPKAGGVADPTLGSPHLQREAGVEVTVERRQDERAFGKASQRTSLCSAWGGGWRGKEVTDFGSKQAEEPTHTHSFSPNSKRGGGTESSRQPGVGQAPIHLNLQGQGTSPEIRIIPRSLHPSVKTHPAPS